MAATEETPRVKLRFPSDDTAMPKHLADLVWDWQQGEGLSRPSHGWPHSKKQLQVLVTCAFQASLRSEEGRPTRFQVLFDQRAVQVTLRLETPLPYTTANLVKLAPTMALGFRRIVVAPRGPASEKLQIVGIRDPDLSPLRSLTAPGGGEDDLASHEMGLNVAVLDPGRVRVTTPGKVFCCELDGGRVRLPIPPGRVPLVGEWYAEAAGLMGPGMTVFASEDVRRTWTSILRTACSARHGGCFLIVPADFADADNLLNVKYGSPSDGLLRCLQARAAIEPPPWGHSRVEQDALSESCVDASSLDRDLARAADLVASLAAVDGAVVLRRDLTVIGFGAEITHAGPVAEEHMIRFLRHPDLEGMAITEGAMEDFGMRHRSAVRFCDEVPGAMAFVASQDGDLTLFFKDGETVAAVSLTPEDPWFP